jgi:putative ATP-binding cassette transporter
MADTAAPLGRHFLRSFVRLAGPYYTQKGHWRPRLLVALLGVAIIAQVAVAIRLNLWSADLFNALERRSTDSAMWQIVVFVLIVIGTMAANTLHLVARRHLYLDWRRWLTGRVIDGWMEDSRHYQVGLIAGDHDNPDGRIAEDIRIATEAAVDLGSSLVYCVLLLVSFVGILWSLSGEVGLFGIPVPGHLVILAFLYAGAGAAVAFLLGRPLVRATDTRQTKEADFRFGLVRARENAEPIAIARAELSERGRLGLSFDTIIGAFRGQSTSLARLLAFTSGYVTVAGVFPILVGTPRFMAGGLTLGALMQSAQAFQQVTAALSWPVDNLPRIAEWRASVERILSLEDAVQVVAVEAARTGETAINLDRAPGPLLGVDALWVAAPDGTAMLSDIAMRLEPRERLLIDGDSEAAAALFRVLAGIWPWGRGRIDLPADAEMMAIGRLPFLPEGPLAAALTFPEPAATFPPADLAAALDSVGLGHLGEQLAVEGDWSRILSNAELQRLTFARLILLRPHWVVLGHATDALDPDSSDAMITLLSTALPDAGIVMIGRHPGTPGVFSRHMMLERQDGKDVLLSEIHERRQAARQKRPRPLRVLDWLRQGYGG